MTKKALITGITGQDGSYLAELLLEKNYEVHGVVRRCSTFNTNRIDHIYKDPHESDNQLFLHYGDLTDGQNLTNGVLDVGPDEIYNLGAQSHVRVSFDSPAYTLQVVGAGALNVLGAARQLNKEKQSFRDHNSIDVLALEKMAQRCPLANLFSLIPLQASEQLQSAQYNPVTAKNEMAKSYVQIPAVENLTSFDALIFTRIKVFAQHQLNDYEAQISLPNKCHDLEPLQVGSSYDVCYELGNYPRFSFTLRKNDSKSI